MSEEAKVSIECQKNEWLAAGAKEEDLVVMGDRVVSKVDLSNPSAAMFLDVSPQPKVEPAKQSAMGRLTAAHCLDDDPEMCDGCGNALLCVCDRRPVIKLNILDTRYHKSDRISRDTQFWVNLTLPGGFSTRDCTLWNNESEARNRAQHIANTETAFRFVIDDGPSQPS